MTGTACFLAKSVRIATGGETNIMAIIDIEKERKKFLCSLYGWSGYVQVYENKVMVKDRTYQLDNIKVVYLSTSTVMSRGYLQVVEYGEKTAKSISEAIKINDIVLLKAMGQNKEAEAVQDCIVGLTKQNAEIKKCRLEKIKSNYKFNELTSQGAVLLKDGLLYGVFETVSTFEKWSVKDTKFISYQDIEFYTVRGSLRQEMSIQGGGVNFDGMFWGGLLFGGVGAMLGSQLGTDISSNTQVTDDRFLFIRSSKLKKDVILAVGEDVDEVLLGLRKVIPQKEYSSEGGFVQKDNPNTSKSCADELRELKALLDDGIITQEEFNSKKKQLLNL